MAKTPQYSSFEEVFRKEYKSLVAAAMRICKDMSIAEDVVQNVFLKFYESEGLKRTDSPGAYLRRAVVTRTLNALRDRKRLQFVGDEALTSAVEHFPTDQAPDIAVMKAKLHQAIQQLPDRARVILILHRFEGLSYKEIAQELDIAPKTVENQLARGLKLLRSYLPKALGILLSLNLHTF
ncbi:MAG: RNA polymerase sigma factor [Saprospiraceae bacterium]